MEDGAGIGVKSAVINLVDSQLQADVPDLVAISISLGIIEASLTHKAKQAWPGDLEVGYLDNCTLYKGMRSTLSRGMTELMRRQDSMLAWPHS